MPASERAFRAGLICHTIRLLWTVADAKSLWSQVRLAFRGSFRDMVYGDSIPDDAEVLECLASIGTSLTRIQEPASARLAK